MSNRVKIKTLKALLPAIQEITGTPAFEWTQLPDGKGTECTVGAYFIEQGSRTYGYAWKLVQSCNKAGGERVILSAPTADGLDAVIRAWLDGFRRGQDKGRV